MSESNTDETWRRLANHTRKLISELQRTARLLRDNGLYEEAVRSYITIVDDDETFDDGYYAYEIGICYETMGDRGKAKEYFDLAVKNDPGRSEFLEAANRVK